MNYIGIQTAGGPVRSMRLDHEGASAALTETLGAGEAVVMGPMSEGAYLGRHLLFDGSAFVVDEAAEKAAALIEADARDDFALRVERLKAGQPSDVQDALERMKPEGASIVAGPAGRGA